MRKRHFNSPKLTQFARLLFSEWRKLRLPVANEAIVIAVSGGADSTSLLLALDELRKAGKLSLTFWVGHLDHGLRPSSREDAKWVSKLARDLGFTPVVSHLKVKEIARAKTENLEQAARNARYEFLGRTAKRKGARFVLTGHTMDDQAETVLLRLMRGSASIGLGGMEVMRPLDGTEKVQLVRPLLWARRSDTEAYCVARKTGFLNDEMNHDETFARVKVRKQLLPLMESFNGRIVEALSRTASMLREDSAALFMTADELLSRAMVTLENSERKQRTKTPALSVDILSSAPSALRRRALRQWISDARGNTRRLGMVHLLSVEKLLEGTVGGRTVELPGGSRVSRRRRLLEFEAEND